MVTCESVDQANEVQIKREEILGLGLEPLLLGLGLLARRKPMAEYDERAYAHILLHLLVQV